MLADYLVKVQYSDYDYFRVSTDEGIIFKKAKGELIRNGNKLVLRCSIAGEITSVNIYRSDDSVVIFNQVRKSANIMHRKVHFKGQFYSLNFLIQKGKNEFFLYRPKFNLETEDSIDGDDRRAVSPMPGVLEKIMVEAGDTVKKGDSLFVVIAMKMEHVVKASRDAKIEKVFYSVGRNVPKDATVVQFAEIESAK